MLHWLETHQTLLYYLGGISLGMLLIQPLVIGAVLIYLPEYYFAEKHRPPHPPAKHMRAELRILLLIFKNMFGFIFLCAGIVMIALPGQGLLTMTLGISMMNFPGKFRLEQWLITRGPTLQMTNRLRARFHRPPLKLNSQQEHTHPCL